jgi:hypothetical protein
MPIGPASSAYHSGAVCTFVPGGSPAVLLGEPEAAADGELAAPVGEAAGAEALLEALLCRGMGEAEEDAPEANGRRPLDPPSRP